MFFQLYQIVPEPAHRAPSDSISPGRLLSHSNCTTYQRVSAPRRKLRWSTASIKWRARLLSMLVLIA